MSDRTASSGIDGMRLWVLAVGLLAIADAAIGSRTMAQEPIPAPPAASGPPSGSTTPRGRIVFASNRDGDPEIYPWMAMAGVSSD